MGLVLILFLFVKSMDFRVSEVSKPSTVVLHEELANTKLPEDVEEEVELMDESNNELTDSVSENNIEFDVDVIRQELHQLVIDRDGYVCDLEDLELSDGTAASTFNEVVYVFCDKERGIYYYADCDYRTGRVIDYKVKRGNRYEEKK